MPALIVEAVAHVRVLRQLAPIRLRHTDPRLLFCGGVDPINSSVFVHLVSKNNTVRGREDGRGLRGGRGEQERAEHPRRAWLA